MNTEYDVREQLDDLDRAALDAADHATGRPYPALPVLAGPQAGESLQGYGCRVLSFVLVHRCTATLDDWSLSIADHVYPVAVAGRDMLPGAVDKLTEARRLILDAIRTRADRARTTEPVSEAPGLAPASHDRGKLAPLSPAPIIRPPAGVAINF